MLSRSLIDAYFQMILGGLRSGRRQNFGLGLSRTHYDDFTTVGHNGALPGTGSVMQYIPELDVYIGAVTNTDSDRVEEPNLVGRVRGALLNEVPSPVN
jgi:hypothetical protein